MAARSHRAARLTLALAAASATLAASPPPALAGTANCHQGATEGCGAHSDGSGYTGVIAIPGLPGGGGSGSSGGGGGCTDCEWLFVPACLPNGPMPGADAMCAGAVMACVERGGGIMMRVYFRQGGGSWQSRGNVCIGGPNTVVTVADVAPRAGQHYREQMRPGAARIAMQPSVQQVVNARGYFMAGGVDAMTRTFGGGGFEMTITATPTYVWDFGDGTTVETQSRGGPYPTGDVTHTYTSAATRTVTLTTRWHAEFTVASPLGTFGPFEIGGPPVAPSSSLQVVVREARATGVTR